MVEILYCDNLPDQISKNAGLYELLKLHLDEYFQKLTSNQKTAKGIHHQVLQKFALRLGSIKSYTTCLYCLRRRPQHKFPCGHSVCENCVQVYGETCLDDPWVFKIIHCILCQKEFVELKVRIHPPTAGVGMITIDGGGIKGDLALAILKKVHEKIGLSVPMQRFFKIASGISSGGLIVMALFINGMSIDQCRHHFQELSQLTFQRRSIYRHSIPYIFDFFVSLFRDCKYPSRNIETALKKFFEPTRTIWDHSYATANGIRVALPVATTHEEPSCRLFTNYNGVGERENNEDYIIGPGSGGNGIDLWEIGRSISAAPWYFEPKYIDQAKMYGQDAAILRNDPLCDALAEMSVLFPHCEKPDFIISIGTGEPSEKELKSRENKEVAGGMFRLIRNGAFARLCRAYLVRMRGKDIRASFQNELRYHRLTTYFDEKEPELDDTTKFAYMETIVQNDKSMSHIYDRIARAVIASQFVFALDTAPVFSKGKYVGTGHLSCSLRSHEVALREILEVLQTAKIYVNRKLVTLINDSCLDASGNFRVQVNLSTSDEVSVTLQVGEFHNHFKNSAMFLDQQLTVKEGAKKVEREHCIEIFMEQDTSTDTLNKSHNWMERQEMKELMLRKDNEMKEIMVKERQEMKEMMMRKDNEMKEIIMKERQEMKELMKKQNEMKEKDEQMKEKDKQLMETMEMMREAMRQKK